MKSNFCFGLDTLARMRHDGREGWRTMCPSQISTHCRRSPFNSRIERPRPLVHSMFTEGTVTPSIKAHIGSKAREIDRHVLTLSATAELGFARLLEGLRGARSRDLPQADGGNSRHRQRDR